VFINCPYNVLIVIKIKVASIITGNLLSSYRGIAFSDNCR